MANENHVSAKLNREDYKWFEQFQSDSGLKCSEAVRVAVRLLRESGVAEIAVLHRQTKDHSKRLDKLEMAVDAGVKYSWRSIVERRLAAIEKKRSE